MSRERRYIFLSYHTTEMNFYLFIRLFGFNRDVEQGTISSFNVESEALCK